MIVSASRTRVADGFAERNVFDLNATKYEIIVYTIISDTEIEGSPLSPSNFALHTLDRMIEHMQDHRDKLKRVQALSPLSNELTGNLFDGENNSEVSESSS